MQCKAPRKRVLSLLLALAMLAVAFATLLPVSVSAGSEKIENFGYQTVVGDGITSSSTQLRFVFTIDSTDYLSAGFVFSLTNSNPTVTGDGCHVSPATAAYRTITADGNSETAPDGRWWIAVKLTGINHISFFTPIYVNAYVEDGEGYHYSSEPVSVSVCEAFDFDMTLYKRSHSASTTLQVSKTLDQIQNGDHFYPTNENPNGKDAYFEVDILWNPTMAHYGNDCFHFCLNYNGGGQDNFFYFYPRDDASSAWCKFAGGFDYGCGTGATPILYGPAGSEGLPKEGYPNLGEYGWHKIGVRYHQAAALDGDNVVYSGVSTLFIDGELVWQVNLNMSRFTTDKNLLFTATNNGGVLEYADNANAANVRMQLRGEKTASTTDPFYLIYRNPSWSVVAPAFTPNVQPVATPAASTIKIAGINFSDAFYFAPNN